VFIICHIVFSGPVDVSKQFYEDLLDGTFVIIIQTFLSRTTSARRLNMRRRQLLGGKDDGSEV